MSDSRGKYIEMLEIKHGSARQIQIAITFNSNVRFRPIIYQYALNWTNEDLEKLT